MSTINLIAGTNQDVEEARRKHRKFGPPGRRADARWPSEDQLVALMAEHQSFSAVARACGLARESLKDFLSTRPQLDARMRAHLRPVMTPEERKRKHRERTRAQQARLQREDPERKRATNRRWARNQHPSKRARWNTYNRARRRALGLCSAVTRAFMVVLLADPCPYCGERAAEIDHIEPLALNGGVEWDNLTGACQSCNRRKNDRRSLIFMLERG